MTRSLIMLLWLLLATGCDRRDVEPHGVEVRDSAGVQISFSRVTPTTPVCPVATNGVRIGSLEGDSLTQFTWVQDVVALPDGTIAVLDGGSSQVKLFSSSGSFISQFGRKGGGPGEFKTAWSLFVRDPDTLVVADYRPWRFSFFSSPGEFVRAVTMDPRIIERPDIAFPLPAGDGFVIQDFRFFRDETAFVDDSASILLYSEAGALADTIATVWLEEVGYLNPETRMVGSPIFGAHAQVGHLNEDQIFYASGRLPQIEVRDPGGRIRRLIRWQSRSREVEERETELWREELRQRYEERFGDQPGIEEAIRDNIGTHRPVADSFPALAAIEITRGGTIWVQEYRRPSDVGPDRWLVFGANGSLRCQAFIPEGIRVHNVGSDFILGTERDQFDVDYVVRYRVDTP